MAKKKKERRDAKRLAVGAKVNIYRFNKKTRRILDAYLLDAKDMTKKGFFVRIDKPFRVGTELRIELMLPGNYESVMLDGKVAWIAKRSQVGYYPGMGIAITRIKRGDSRKIQKFLKEKIRNYRHALELKKMYLQLKQMGGKLYDMEQCHSHAIHFKKVIDNAIREIDRIAHVLDKEVWEVKRL